jgi:osmotically-inducible protein OsmY
MSESEAMQRAARAALERRGEIDLQAHPINLSIEDGVLVLRGEVDHIGAKRSARQELTRLFGADRVLDRLRLVPEIRLEDGTIADALYEVLIWGTALQEYSFTVYGGVAMRETPARGMLPTGSIEATIKGGVVTLNGVVESLLHKRLVDVLAWWTPGVRAVDNRLHVRPEEHDSDEEIGDALRMVFAQDPLLDARQIVARVENRRVTLEGLVAAEEQRRIAGRDAWYVLGVHDVENRLSVEGLGD